MSDLPKTTKIHDLPKVSEVNDSDIFIIQSDESTNKIDGETLKSVMQQQAVEAISDHTSNNEIHVTKTEKELWNSMSGGGSDFFVTKEELEEALDGIIDGTQPVGDSAKLGGRDASEYLTTESNVSASTITAGTFKGDVVAPASTNFSTAHVTNHVVVDTKPTVGDAAPYPIGTYVHVRK